MATSLAVSLRMTDTQSGAIRDEFFDRLPVRVGRSGLNDMSIDSTFVSHFHLVLERAEDRLVLRDLGSRNGVLVAGKRAVPHERVDLTAAGNTFEVGPFRFQVSTSMVERRPSDERTNVMLAVDGTNQEATQAWQAFVDAPQQRTREPRDVALQGLRYLARTYVPQAGALDDAESITRFLGKMKQALDLLFGAYVPLRDGCRQLQLHIAGRQGSAAGDPAEAADPVMSATSPLDVASHVLNWKDTSTDVVRSLQRTFADFVITQIAALDGVTRGVHTLYEELAPSTVQALFAKKGSMRIGPFRAGGLWQLYLERYKQLSQDDALARMFGAEFVSVFRRGESGGSGSSH